MFLPSNLIIYSLFRPKYHSKSITLAHLLDSVLKMVRFNCAIPPQFGHFLTGPTPLVHRLQNIFLHFLHLKGALPSNPPSLVSQFGHSFFDQNTIVTFLNSFFCGPGGGPVRQGRVMLSIPAPRAACRVPRCVLDTMAELAADELI